VRSSGAIRGGRNVVDIASARRERLGGAYGRDDVVNCLAGCSGVRFILQERCVGGIGVTVEAVGRQCGQAVLLRLPFIVGVSIGGVDAERLTAEVGQGRRLVNRGGAFEKFLDVAAEVRGGRGVGTRLVPRAWRKSAERELGDQVSGSDVGDRATTRRRD
jgi:hypothetical protein